MAMLHDRADELFDRVNVYPGDGQRNHCLRLVDFAGLHADAMGSRPDGELLYLAAMLHDLGLMVPHRPGTTYLTRTVQIARDELGDLGLDRLTWRTLEECLLYNHAVTVRIPLSPLAEAFRRAVFTEHSRGRRRFGLARRPVRDVFRRHPYANFGRVLADFVWKTTTREPGTIPAIFLPWR